MDVPTGLDALLFPNHKEGEVSNWHLDYVSELVTFTPAKISSEPLRLDKEKQNVERETKDLAFQHYKVFIQSSRCTSGIRSEVQNTLQDTGTLQSHIPELSSACHSFAMDAKEITQKRKNHYTTLEQHNTLLELLELPQLMDTCVKNQCYEDALELEHYTRKMHRENPNIVILSQILAEIELSTESMALQLHNQLCSQCTLPESFKIVNYLRKLAIYNEVEIRVAFLQCKGQYLHHVLQQIPRGNYFMTISKMVDTTRSEIQDIINQYTTLFGEDLKLDKDVTSILSSASTGNILYSWTLCKINEFLDRLQSSLMKVKDGSFLSNILASSMFFGKNMARLGLDFRGLLRPIFEGVVLNIFEKDLERAVSQFGTHLRKYKNLSAHQGLSEYTPKLEDTQDSISPPIILLDFPPLAILTNVILSTFNDLRTCWLHSTQGKLSKILYTLLHDIIQKLQEHRTQNVNSNDPEELDLFTKMCKIASTEFLPFITNCFSSIFGNQKLIDLVALQQLMSPLLKENS